MFLSYFNLVYLSSDKHLSKPTIAQQQHIWYPPLAPGRSGIFRLCDCSCVLPTFSQARLCGATTAASVVTSAASVSTKRPAALASTQIKQLSLLSWCAVAPKNQLHSIEEAHLTHVQHRLNQRHQTPRRCTRDHPNLLRQQQCSATKNQQGCVFVSTARCNVHWRVIGCHAQHGQSWARAA